MARIFFACVAFFATVTASAQVAPVARSSSIRPAQTVIAHNGLVVSQEQRASRIGVEFSTAAATPSTPPWRSDSRWP